MKTLHSYNFLYFSFSGWTHADIHSAKKKKKKNIYVINCVHVKFSDTYTPHTYTPYICKSIHSTQVVHCWFLYLKNVHVDHFLHTCILSIIYAPCMSLCVHQCWGCHH